MSTINRCLGWLVSVLIATLPCFPANAQSGDVAPSSTCIPTLSVDYSRAPDLAQWVTASVAPAIKQWYPVIGDALAAPDYADGCAIRIALDPNYTERVALTVAATGLITVNASYFRNNQRDIGAMIHEAAHVIQNYPPGAPYWIVEGIADWVRYYMYKDRNVGMPPPSAYYTDGYATAAYFLEWVRANYDPALIRKINTAAHRGAYSDAIILQAAGGQTLDQLWQRMTGATARLVGPVIGVGGQCLDIPGSNAWNGNILQLYACNGTGAQVWSQLDSADGRSRTFRGLGKCLDVQRSGTADGTPVWLWECNGTPAQQWIAQTDGTILSAISGKCLTAGSTRGEAGIRLQIATCRANAREQLWRIGAR